MIINKLVWLNPIFSATLALPAFAGHEDTFAPVAQNARERTAGVVTWEREESARQQTLAQVRNLLKRPLTANIAAEIAPPQRDPPVFVMSAIWLLIWSL